jgi:hypothetical protein
MKKTAFVALLILLVGVPASAQRNAPYTFDEDEHSRASCEMPDIINQTIILVSKPVEILLPDQANFKVGDYWFGSASPQIFAELLAFLTRGSPRQPKPLAVSLTKQTDRPPDDAYYLNGALKFLGEATGVDVYDFEYELVEGTKGHLAIQGIANSCVWRTLNSEFGGKLTLIFRFVSGT